MHAKDVNYEITADGCVMSVYDDDSDLRLLGDLQVTRLSDVEFDDDLQAWKVKFRCGITLPGEYKDRIRALNAEIDYVEAHLGEFGDWVQSQHPEAVPVYVDPSIS